MLMNTSGLSILWGFCRGWCPHGESEWNFYGRNGEGSKCKSDFLTSVFICNTRTPVVPPWLLREVAKTRVGEATASTTAR